MEEIIQGGLEGNEYVSLLSWVMNTYPGVELMSHPDLKVDLSIISPLIRPELLKDLEQQYLKVGNLTIDFVCLLCRNNQKMLFLEHGKELRGMDG